MLIERDGHFFLDSLMNITEKGLSFPCPEKGQILQLEGEIAEFWKTRVALRNDNVQGKQSEPFEGVKRVQTRQDKYFICVE